MKDIKSHAVLILTVFAFSALAGNPWKRVVLNRFGNCPNSENKSSFLSNVRVKVREPKLIINGNITIKADLPKELSVRVLTQKCELNSNTCKTVSNDTMTDLCRLLTIGSPLLSNIRPKWQCPVKKGNYMIKNGEFDMTLVLLKDFENSRWITTFKMFSAAKKDKNKELACQIIDGNILPANG